MYFSQFKVYVVHYDSSALNVIHGKGVEIPLHTFPESSFAPVYLLTSSRNSDAKSDSKNQRVWEIALCARNLSENATRQRDH